MRGWITVMSDLVGYSYVSVKSPCRCRKHTNAFMFARAHTDASTSTASFPIGSPAGSSFLLFTPLPHSNKSISRSPTSSLFVPRQGCQSYSCCLSIVSGCWSSSSYTTMSSPARRLRHKSSFPSPSGCLWREELPAPDRFSYVCMCVCVVACVRGCVLIIQSVLKLKDASPDAALIVGVFNGERQMRWEAKGGATAVKKYQEECGGGLLVRDEASFLKQPGALFSKLLYVHTVHKTINEMVSPDNNTLKTADRLSIMQGSHKQLESACSFAALLLQFHR